ncbi:hypothetical protein [Psychrilyobacter atlanticus]|uniref:hypothetical protein n=1 Tax=Psychrilyobacter atlanticus TaxID=271091 RepID=UPI0003FE30FC|nr:hypothetical protein [Psychrilyobacter atlanticus]
MFPDTAIAANWIIGGLLAINLAKPLWERVFKRVDKGSDRIDRIEREVEEIKIKLSEKVSREEFNKLMMKLSEIEGYLKAKKEG